MGDWRNAGPGDEPLRYPDIAMGYLSRNPRYHAEYASALRRVRRGAKSAAAMTLGLVKRWGMSFTASPDAAFDPSRVLTMPGLSPSTITLMPTDPRLRQREPSDMAGLPPLPMGVTDMIVGDWRHVILPDCDGDHHIQTPTTDTGQLGVFLPLDRNLPVRLKAIARFHQHMLGQPTGPPPLLVPPVTRQRHIMLMRVLDGHLAGARAKELAAVLIDPDVLGYNAAEWADCRQRKRINRWIVEASELMNGGYLRLLRGG